MTTADSGAAANWGSWRFDANSLALVLHGEGLPNYRVALRSITSSACMLDIIFGIRGKPWAHDRIIADLISAFQDLFDPQATLCRAGHDATIDPIEHLNSKTVH